MGEGAGEVEVSDLHLWLLGCCNGNWDMFWPVLWLSDLVMHTTIL